MCQQPLPLTLQGLKNWDLQPDVHTAGQGVLRGASISGDVMLQVRGAPAKGVLQGRRGVLQVR